MERQQPETRSARAEVAAATRGIHEALHNDAILRRLTEPDISAGEYLAALSVLSSFYHAVEAARTRFGCWLGFSLHGECAALARDLAGRAAPEISLGFACERSLLGGLYVAHGASFGRGLFCRNLETALPGAPRHFVRQKTDKTLWRSLLETMEREAHHAGGLAALQSGAAASFDSVRVLSQRQQDGPLPDAPAP